MENLRGSLRKSHALPAEIHPLVELSRAILFDSRADKQYYLCKSQLLSTKLPIPICSVGLMDSSLSSMPLATIDRSFIALRKLVLSMALATYRAACRRVCHHCSVVSPLAENCSPPVSQTRGRRGHGPAACLL